MHGVVVRAVGLGLAAVTLTAATVGADALFRAPLPGADLKPIDGAELVIDLIQGEHSVLWSSLGGDVGTIIVRGWPSRGVDAELGGALIIQRPEQPLADVVEFGEKPMTLEFRLAP